MVAQPSLSQTAGAIRVVNSWLPGNVSPRITKQFDHIIFFYKNSVLFGKNIGISCIKQNSKLFNLCSTLYGTVNQPKVF
jgi:hypothetical protein